jgi:hypothetical protein
MAKIKKGDTVLVIAGKDKGVSGKIIEVLGERVLVEGVNRVKRHTKQLATVALKSAASSPLNHQFTFPMSWLQMKMARHHVLAFAKMTMVRMCEFPVAPERTSNVNNSLTTS